MRWFRRSAIRSSGVILMVFIISIFSIYAVISYKTVGDFFEKSSRAGLFKDAVAISSEIESTISRYDILVKQMAANHDFRALAIEIKNKKYKRSHPLYKRAVDQLKGIKSIDESIALVYIAPSGINDIIADLYDHDMAEGFDLDTRTWYKEMVNTQKMNLSAPYVDARTGSVAVTIARPLYNEGIITGAVAIDIMIDDIYKMMSEYKVGENGYILILNQNGKVIYHPELNISRETDIADADYYLSDMKNVILSGQSGVVEYETNNRKNYMAYVPVNHSNLVVAAIIPKSEVIMPVQNFLKSNLIILSGIIAAIAAFIISLTGRITRPIIEMSENIERYEKSDRRITIPEKYFQRTDEIGILAKELDYMSRSIEKNIVDMDDRNKELFEEIERRKTIQMDIHRLKNFDSLTKLYNTDYFEFMVASFIDKNPSPGNIHSMILINIDNFRLINEARGFEFGNQVLLTFSRKLTELADEKDIVARLGNDEFAVFKTGVENYEQLYKFIVDFSTEINNYHKVAGEGMFVNVTMGISVYPSDAGNCQDLLKKATSALNNAKNDTSMDFEFFNMDINKQSVYKYELKNRLRYALEKEELMVYYQPQIDMKTKKVKGMEALLRWKHDGEMIPPDKFIPVAEEYNLIIPIGEWVLRNVCKFGYELHKRGCDIQVAVNLSRIQFKNPYIVSLVSDVLIETKLPPHLLELEITESILMDNEQECEIILESFRNMGIKTAIDDFGTGYSSLSYLKKFAVDRIKIDRTFIKEIPEKDDGAIAKIIIELASVLHLDVIAEGVETGKQMDFLVNNSCLLAQGFLFSRPLSNEHIIEFIEKNQDVKHEDGQNVLQM